MIQEAAFLVGLGTFGVILWLTHTVFNIKNELLIEPEAQEPLDLTPLVHAIKEGVTDEVMKVIGKMEPPSASDHLMGMLSTVIQAKFLSNLNIEGLNLPAAAHGEKENLTQKENTQTN